MYDKLIKRLRECTAEMNGEKTLWYQAADAIEELQQITTHYEEESKGWWLAACDAKEERERLKEQIPKWIPVTERLPEEWKTVLTFQPTSDDKGIIQTCVYIGIPGKWRQAWNHDFFELPVTHWMPLPQPPKDGES